MYFLQIQPYIFKMKKQTGHLLSLLQVVDFPISKFNLKLVQEPIIYKYFTFFQVFSVVTCLTSDRSWSEEFLQTNSAQFCDCVVPFPYMRPVDVTVSNWVGAVRPRGKGTHPMLVSFFFPKGRPLINKSKTEGAIAWLNNRTWPLKLNFK